MGAIAYDNTQRIVPAILQIDPYFSNEKFLAWVKEVFFTVQYAWMERDAEKMRGFLKKELFNQTSIKIKQYINSGKINVLERINVNHLYLQKYVRDCHYEYITVYL